MSFLFDLEPPEKWFLYSISTNAATQATNADNSNPLDSDRKLNARSRDRAGLSIVLTFAHAIKKKLALRQVLFLTENHSARTIVNKLICKRRRHPACDAHTHTHTKTVRQMRLVLELVSFKVHKIERLVNLVSVAADEWTSALTKWNINTAILWPLMFGGARACDCEEKEQKQCASVDESRNAEEMERY